MFFRMRNFKGLTLALFLACLVLISAPAYSGGIPVFDAVNLMQNILGVLQEIQTVSNEATQIQNQMRQIQYKEQSLQTLGSGSYDQLNGLLNSNIRDLDAFLRNLNSIGYSLGGVRGQFDSIFPQDAAWDKVRLSDYGDYFKDWNREVTNSSRSAMEAQSVLSRVRQNQRQAIDILSQSRGANGEVRQLQASNEMLSVIAGQMGDMTETMAATGRVIATADAASAAEKRASRRAAEVAMRGYTTSTEVKPKYDKLPTLR